jgi:hypothetical protein
MLFLYFLSFVSYKAHIYVYMYACMFVGRWEEDNRKEKERKRVDDSRAQTRPSSLSLPQPLTVAQAHVRAHEPAGSDWLLFISTCYNLGSKKEKIHITSINFRKSSFFLPKI